jgi:hypothetical protein
VVLEEPASVDSAERGVQDALAALLTKIVDNLQFSIKDVHIRYEDEKWSSKEVFFSLFIYIV